jgi:maltooligosyltrehalose synthase
MVALARGFGPQLVLAVAGRLYAKHGMDAQGTEGASMWEGSGLALPRGLAAGTCRDVFTNRILQPELQQGRSVLPMKEVFAYYPVALLEKLQGAK